MANPTAKWIEAISVLNDLTQSGELRWQVENRTGIINTGIGGSLGFLQSPSAVYRARYMDKWFRMKKLDIPSVNPFSVGGGTNYSLEIIDDGGNTLFQVPENTGLSDLFNSIQYQLSGVDELLNSLLSQRGGR
jgi:hypothetical protein